MKPSKDQWGKTSQDWHSMDPKQHDKEQADYAADVKSDMDRDEARDAAKKAHHEAMEAKGMLWDYDLQKWNEPRGGKQPDYDYVPSSKHGSYREDSDYDINEYYKAQQ